jgi:hypothetical protein
VVSAGPYLLVLTVAYLLTTRKKSPVTQKPPQKLPQKKVEGAD